MCINMKLKACTKCNQNLPATNEYFYKQKTNKDGLQKLCKSCRNEYQKQYRKENKEQRKEKDKQYYQENKEQRNEYQKQYNKENAEQVNEYQKQYRKENKEHRNTYNKQFRKENKEQLDVYQKQYYQENKEQLNEKDKQYRKENKEQIKKYKKQYRKENPEIVRENNAKRRATKLKSTPKWFSDYDRMVFRELVKECRRLENETGIPHHVDHVIPLRGKLVSGLHCAANFQILTESENWSKNNTFDPKTHQELNYNK